MSRFFALYKFKIVMLKESIVNGKGKSLTIAKKSKILLFNDFS